MAVDINPEEKSVGKSGLSYFWAGVKSYLSDMLTTKVSKLGDTMTGNLTIDKDSPEIELKAGSTNKKLRVYKYADASSDGGSIIIDIGSDGMKAASIELTNNNFGNLGDALKLGIRDSEGTWTHYKIFHEGNKPSVTLSEIGAASEDHTHTLDSLGAASSDHTHTPASIGAAASSHTHAASAITEGTLGGRVYANASAVLTYNGRQVRNILFCTSTSSISVANGDVIHLYE